MQPFVWNESMTVEQTKDGAYWERNMLALLLAQLNNAFNGSMGVEQNAGWYTHGEYRGWTRVISMENGAITFHVPDDFNLGSLPQIEPNWDGHTTEEKWKYVADQCGIT